MVFWDPRPDFDGLDYCKLAHNVVAQLKGRAPAVSCINMLTHRVHSFFSNPDGRVTRNFRAMLDVISRLATKQTRVRSATLAEVVDDVHASPPDAFSFDPSVGRVFLGVDVRPA